MNEFEKKMNELRLQYKQERIQIQKDSNLAVGHINTAIGQVNSIEAREALRAEKRRIHYKTCCAMKINRECYMKQLELLNDEYNTHLEKNPSKQQLRRMAARLCRDAESRGEKSISLAFGDNRRCTITFD